MGAYVRKKGYNHPWRNRVGVKWSCRRKLEKGLEEEKKERVGRVRLTKPEDPEEAHEAKFSGNQRSDGAFTEEIDNDT